MNLEEGHATSAGVACQEATSSMSLASGLDVGVCRTRLGNHHPALLHILLFGKVNKVVINIITIRHVVVKDRDSIHELGHGIMLPSSQTCTRTPKEVSRNSQQSKTTRGSNHLDNVQSKTRFEDFRKTTR